MLRDSPYCFAVTGVHQYTVCTGYKRADVRCRPSWLRGIIPSNKKKHFQNNPNNLNIYTYQRCRLKSHDLDLNQYQSQMWWLKDSRKQTNIKAFLDFKRNDFTGLLTWNDLISPSSSEVKNYIYYMILCQLLIFMRTDITLRTSSHVGLVGGKSVFGNAHNNRQTSNDLNCKV